MKLYCRYCDLEQDGQMCDTGSIACVNCGNVILEDCLVEEVVFRRGPGGQHSTVGRFEYESRLATNSSGRASRPSSVFQNHRRGNVPLPSDSTRRRSVAEQAMMVYCRYCDVEQDGQVCDSEVIACADCGSVLLEDNLVEEVMFIGGQRQ